MARLRLQRYRGIRVRLALLIVLATVALAGYLVYDGIRERSREEARAHDNLTRLATFAATAERTQFDATENFLGIVKQAPAFTKIALAPNDQDAYDACTRGLFVSDQLVPGTRFSLWDLNGSILCSSRAAKTGQFSAANRAWFHQVKQRQGFATGTYEVLDDTGDPSLSFGMPITDPATQRVVAYISGAISVRENQLLPAGESLPESGRLTVVDQDGVVVNSTSREPGTRLALFPPSFLALRSYLDSDVEQGNGRTGAAVRITDGDDGYVAVIVSADNALLVAPLGETLLRVLMPVLALTFATLVAVWLLGQRWIVRPIEALGAASDALASGALGARADVHTGVSELDQLAAKFNEMASTRERAAQAKDEFLGLVSHELKTPITMTLGNAEILKNRADQLDPEARRMAIDDIHESTLRLAAIVDNLLVLARLERGVGLDSEPLSLLRIAQIAADQESRMAPSRTIAVTGDASVLALGGETYVRQVLLNFISNALKYSPSGEPIEVRVEETEDASVVRVLDRGQGIDPSELDAVFQPFYRSERTSGDAEGMGIGLSVCRRLVEAMGGTIWARERPGGGTEFGFSLPRLHEEERNVPLQESMVPPPSDAAIPARSNPRLLLQGGVHLLVAEHARRVVAFQVGFGQWRYATRRVAGRATLCHGGERVHCIRDRRRVHDVVAGQALGTCPGRVRAVQRR